MRKPSEIESAFSPKDALNGKSSFFLVGIGGAGMSALARMLKHRGFDVQGTDSTDGPEVRRLISEGIGVHIGHSGEPLQPEMALVVSDAIDLEKSPEVARAHELSVPMVRRSQALGWLLRNYKVIAITGTHGKTTTTGMTGMALEAAGLDPLVIVGASIPAWKSPIREGKGEWAVVEACEAYDSFHDLEPTLVVLTNLELDHIDFHKTWENLRGSVVRFADSVVKGGKLIFASADDGANQVANLTKSPTVAFTDDGSFTEEQLGTPGHHNVLNATAALEVAKAIGADLEAAKKGITHFAGAERRLQVLQSDGMTVIDDYAHHPTEVEASLKAIRQRWAKDRRLVVVFQPHLYSRTQPLVKEFAEALSNADYVVITDIYAAREDPMPGVSSARIAEKVTKPLLYVPSRHQLTTKVAEILEPGDVVVGMGAGNISEFAPALIKELARNKDLKSPKNVIVFYGGDSAEREVSLHSGLAIFNALKSKKHNVRLLDMTDKLFTNPDFSEFIGPNRPDAVFLGIHGTHAEDGAIQGLLELLGIPYTGSGIQASAIAMDKGMTKNVLEMAGITTPKGVLLSSPDDDVPFGAPYVVKPNAQGSTVGLTFVEDHACLCSAIQNAFAYDRQVLVEEWLRGMEISTPVLCNKPLLPVEIAPNSGFYDFESKYTPGATSEIVPARLPEAVLKQAQEIALKAHQALRCEGATRTDAIVVPPKNEGDEYNIYVLEVNTLPGMTGTSLLPNSAAGMGIAFDDLCQILLEDALSGKKEKA